MVHPAIDDSPLILVQAHIIGLHGRSQAGKDTIADYLVRQHHYMKLSFAEPVKAAAHLLLDVPRALESMYKDTYLPNYPFTLRDAYIAMTEGLEARLCPELFLIINSNRIANLIRNGQHKIVIQDVRYEWSAFLIHELGGEVWNIRRGEPPCGLFEAGWQWLMERRLPLSERTFPGRKIDRVLYNNRSIEKLLSRCVDPSLDAYESTHTLI